MKLAIQAFIASVIIHLVYLISTIGLGYIKTKFFRPTISDEWEKIDYLQNEVGIGMSISPLFPFFSMIVVTILCGGTIYLYKNVYRRK